HGAQPLRANVVLHQHAVVAVVVRRAEAAVDLGGREDEAAPPAQRDDLVHRDLGGRHRGTSYLGSTRDRPLCGAARRVRRDGRGLHDADVVLVGVSRTSKTPLSIYLGYLGHKAANVPVVKGIEPPADLFTVDQRKIVGLTIDPNRLVEIRRARARTMGARSRQYAELIEIYEELEQAAKLHRRISCPVIDISELSIEETAHRVLRVVEERKTAA